MSESLRSPGPSAASPGRSLVSRLALVRLPHPSRHFPGGRSVPRLGQPSFLGALLFLAALFVLGMASASGLRAQEGTVSAPETSVLETASLEAEQPLFAELKVSLNAD